MNVRLVFRENFVKRKVNIFKYIFTYIFLTYIFLNINLADLVDSLDILNKETISMDQVDEVSKLLEDPLQVSEELLDKTFDLTLDLLLGDTDIASDNIADTEQSISVLNMADSILNVFVQKYLYILIYINTI